MCFLLAYLQKRDNKCPDVPYKQKYAGTTGRNAGKWDNLVLNGHLLLFYLFIIIVTLCITNVFDLKRTIYKYS